MISKYKQLNKDVGYIKLIIANTISTFGSTIDNIAFTWLVTQLTDSATWVAIIFGASMLPMMVVQPFVAVWVERAHKRNIILLMDALGAIVMILVSILYIKNLLTPELLLIITLINATIETVRIPAGIALVPQILHDENYELGTGLHHSATQIATLIGLALTGVCIATLGLASAFIIDAITFILSFLFIACIKVTKQIQEKRKRETSFLYELKHGFLLFMEIKQLYTLCMLSIAVNFLSTAINSYIAFYFAEYLQLSITAYSTFSLVFALGTIVGGLTVAFLPSKISNKTIFKLNVVTVALYYFVLAFSIYITYPLIRTLSILFFTIFLGIFAGILGIKVSSTFMRLAPKTHIARFAGIFNSLSSTCIPIASVTLALLSTILTVNQIFIVFGIASLALYIILNIHKSINIEAKEETHEL